MLKGDVCIHAGLAWMCDSCVYSIALHVYMGQLLVSMDEAIII